MPTIHLLLVAAISALLVACDGANDPNTNAALAPVVKTLPIEPAGQAVARLSGTIEAERRNPLSFQIGGRVIGRHVNAGEHVKQGQLLFELDERDLTQAKRAADAQVAAATQALETANDELARAQRMFNSRYVSEQALDQAKLRVAEARTRTDAVIAAAQQAANALAYAKLTAPANGIVTETFAEIGQVVTPGQPVGDFALDGTREIEVYLPQGLQAPESATAEINDQLYRAIRREVSGAADRNSRTFRARYTLPASASALPIGTIGELLLTETAAQGLASVPLGAVDERGQGPQLWVIVDGKTKSVPIKVITLSDETAQIQTTLPIGTPVVAMGTHLLKPNMVVRVQPK